MRALATVLTILSAVTAVMLAINGYYSRKHHKWWMSTVVPWARAFIDEFGTAVNTAKAQEYSEATHAYLLLLSARCDEAGEVMAEVGISRLRLAVFLNPWHAKEEYENSVQVFNKRAAFLHPELVSDGKTSHVH